MIRVRVGLLAMCLPAVIAFAADTPAAPSLHPKVKIVTNRGEMVFELDAEKAPGTVLNFVQYAEDKFYDGTLFHRVMKDFMVQGGGFLLNMDEKTEGLRQPIRLESDNGLHNVMGTIAMARRTHPQSATAQFFINVGDNRDKLDYKPIVGSEGYAVFGKMVEGTDTLEKIRNTEVAMHPKFKTRDGTVTPTEPVLIQTVQVVTPLDKAKAKQLAAQVAVAQEKAEKEQKLQADQALPARIKKLEDEYKKTFVKTESGLRYLDVREGKGISPKRDDSVDIIYVGTLVDGTEIDSSAFQARQKKGVYENAGGAMTYDLKKLNKGLQEGIGSMKEGGKRIIAVPSELAYGPEGIPGRIPTDAAMFYEIELLAVKSSEEK